MRPFIVITAVLATLLAGCNRAAQEAAAPSDAPTIDAASPPSETASPAEGPTQTPVPQTEPAATPPAGEGQEVQLWFLRADDDRGSLFVEPELTRLRQPTRAVARATMELLVAAEPRDPLLENLIPEGTRVLDVSLHEGTLTVDLDLRDDHPAMGSGYEALYYEQIRHTGAQFPAVRRVAVLEEGEPPGSGHLDDPGAPHRPDADAVSPVVVTSPEHAERHGAGSITARGTANVYEATVLLRLKDANGTVVAEEFTTATCGTGCRGDWEHTFTVSAPGRYILIAAASDPSDGEGPPPFKAIRRFSVR